MKRAKAGTLFLFGIAGVGFGQTISLYAGKYYKQWDVRRHPAYVDALVFLGDHTQATASLGPPLTFKRVNVFHKENFITANRCQLSVPVVGKEDQGVYYVRAIRSDEPEEGEPWQLIRLELKLDKAGEVFLMLENGKYETLLDPESSGPAYFDPDDRFLLNPLDPDPILGQRRFVKTLAQTFPFLFGN